MNSSPNPTSSGPRYQMIRELGRNRAGGRITYLARDNKTQQLVVIKRFLFAQSGSDGSGFKAYEPEIQVLQELDHPSIPRYLDSFKTKGGFCLVQEYKDTQSLAVPRSFDPEEIKQIAISVLEILVYLQNRNPAVIHRDIKPENILVAEQLNVYLVDFGFAQISDGEVAISNIPAGTFGFMAPEQLYNHPLSEATDLYGLGATLICLLTGTKSTVIDTLIDQERRLNFKPLLPQLSLRFVDWLSKMVEPKLKDRFSNATAALSALKSINVFRTPEVKFSPPILEFKAKQWGEKLTQTITVTNSVPETLLKGNWKVAAHESDPKYAGNSHVWISFEPANFQGNCVTCQITVDTKRLMVDKTYIRQILLDTTYSPEPYALNIKVFTTLLASPKLPYISLALLFVLAWFCAIPIAKVVSSVFAAGVDVRLPLMGVVLVIGFLGGILMATAGTQALTLPIFQIPLQATRVTGSFGLLGLFLLAMLGFPFLGLIANWLVGLVIGFLVGAVIKNHNDRGFSQKEAVAIPLLLTGFSMSLSSGFNVGFNPFLILSALVTGIFLAAILFERHEQREKLLAEYRQLEQKRRLIKP